MYKVFATFLMLITLSPIWGQVLPRENSELHYRIIGFAFPKKQIRSKYKIEIASGCYYSEDSFKKNIITTLSADTNRVIGEVPAFGKQYTWRIIYTDKNAVSTKSELHHFSTLICPELDTAVCRLRIIKPSEKYKDAYVFADATGALYDMEGHLVWYLPKINELKGCQDTRNTRIAVRDLKISLQGTITFLEEGSEVYEVNYDGNILWKVSKEGERRAGTLRHHEFTRLKNDHYMALGEEHVLLELRPAIGKSAILAQGERIMWSSSNKKYYQKISLQTVIEYNKRGDVVWLWKPSEHMSVTDLYDKRTADGLFDISLHANSFYFDEKNKFIYVSLRDVSHIIKVRYPEGSVVSSYSGTDTTGGQDAGGDIFCYQHSCKRTEDEYLYLYNNNGCHDGKKPSIIMMKEPVTAQGRIKKIWEYECNVAGMDRNNPSNMVFTTGGNVVELPDHSFFVSMCSTYGNMFIVSREKNILWNAILEYWSAADNKWDIHINYRASIIVDRTDLERLIWSR